MGIPEDLQGLPALFVAMVYQLMKQMFEALNLRSHGEPQCWVNHSVALTIDLEKHLPMQIWKRELDTFRGDSLIMQELAELDSDWGSSSDSFKHLGYFNAFLCVFPGDIFEAKPPPWKQSFPIFPKVQKRGNMASRG